MWTETHKTKVGYYVTEATRDIGVSILSTHVYSSRLKNDFFLRIRFSVCLWVFSSREALLVFPKPIVDRLSVRFDSFVN